LTSYRSRAAAKWFATCAEDARWPEGKAMPSPASFLPSQDGLAFTNAWPSEPAVVVSTPFGQISIGNAAAGLCGGMVFAALDYWQTGIAPPAARPAPGQPLYRYIVQRLIDSLHLPAGRGGGYPWRQLPGRHTSLRPLRPHDRIPPRQGRRPA